jgi:deoxycytidylate deaminase
MIKPLDINSEKAALSRIAIKSNEKGEGDGDGDGDDAICDNDTSTVCSSDPSNMMHQLKIDPCLSASPAHKFELYGWKPDPELTEDELYLDVVFLITRSTQDDGRQGHMGALIVRPEKSSSSSNSIAVRSDVCIECTGTTIENSKDRNEKDDGVISSSSPFDEGRFFQNILGAGTNTPLFDNNESTSDIHAEINALGEACKSSQSTENCTAYITIPPCKRCFAALVTFGIRRIVTRQASPFIIRETSQ